MTDELANYRAAAEAGDVDALVRTFHPDVELVSPVSGRMVFRGVDDLRVLMTAVHRTARNQVWGESLGQGQRWVLVGSCSVGPLTMTDAMVLDLADDGRIRRIRPHVGPWLAATLFALMLPSRLLRHFGVVRRALSSEPAPGSSTR